MFIHMDDPVLVLHFSVVILSDTLLFLLQPSDRCMSLRTHFRREEKAYIVFFTKWILKYSVQYTVLLEASMLEGLPAVQSQKNDLLCGL